ncbi:alpha/beta hydrolase [Virgibacillus kekensis]|uniref:Alpha/beta hydrolase n=1 Tax=Virgibacillus kekensis TaxID=202261 RepID=A0ABV9DGC9_9BACI
MNRTTHYFYSNLLDKTIEYQYVLPDSVIDEAYLLYVQDGNDYLELGGVEDTYKLLKKHFPELMNKLLLVLIHPGTSEERWHSYHRKGKYFQQYMDFMYQEFIPEVESDLKQRFKNLTIVKRGLIGDSLAGNISLNIAALNPELWTHLLLQSAAITEGDIDAVVKREKLDLKVYQTVGVYEDEFISTITDERLYIYSRNKVLYERLKNKVPIILFKEKEESHLWEFWKRNLPEALEFFLRN